MSIIPNPGLPPEIAPTSRPRTVNAATYTITEDTVFHRTGTNRVFDGWNLSITNYGTVWLDSGGVHAWLVTGGQPEVFNHGLIYIHGESQVELSPLGRHLVNTGSIYAISDSGWARVLSAEYNGYVENSGLIAAQSLGIDPEYSFIWNATAIDSPGGVEVINHAGGSILAEAPNLAIAIFSGGADLQPGHAIVTNAGLIEANATGPGGTSIGIYVSQPGYNVATIINSGTIRADLAIYATYSAETVSNSQEWVQNLTGGVIDGFVFLDIGDDQFDNDGTVIGNVDMGAGNDIFGGAGTVSGVVSMGFGADHYTGSGENDRAVGGRGDDTMNGRGGRDLLMGGFGNDILRGDAGNDGLFGEWGNDVIFTLNGDHADGGSGNDRIVLGDYTFAAVRGGEGVDTLVMASGTRNFSLEKMLTGGRISGFEALELQAGQNIAITANAVSTFTGSNTALRIDAAAGNTIHLAGNWTRGADVTVGGVLYEAWTQGSARVLVNEAATVTPGSNPNYAGLDAVAGGAAAFQPGAAAGLDYSLPSEFVSRFVLYDETFTVDAQEIFYSDGAPIFVSTSNLTFINNGELYSLDDGFPSARGLDFYGPTLVINNGLIAVEETAPLDSVYYYPSIGIAMGGGADNTVLENTGEISVYSVPGSAIGVHNMGVLRNEGLIVAVSEHSRAIAVNYVFASHILDDTQTFFNTGVIYAEGGGAGAQNYAEGDRIVPEIYAATGVAAYGSLTNDGVIRADLGANAAPGTQTAGVYILNHYEDFEKQAGVTNYGTIEGTIAIKFEENYYNDYNHWVVNNGLLLGDVEFEDGNDHYDNTNGETVGIVFGFGGDDTFLGGAYDDIFEGGTGNNTLYGRAGSDTASYLRAAAGVTVDLRISSAQDTIGAGIDTLIGIENLLGSSHDDVLIGDNRANFIDGGEGADQMAGGKGHDFYIVDHAGDRITEVGGGGIDTVVSYLQDYTLAAAVENLILGSGAVSGTGNSLANQITGNSAGNTLLGGGGNDVLSGLAGDDILNGGGGADRMVGGLGNDSYYVNVINDVVVETANGGIDTVFSSIGLYRLGSNVENAGLLNGGVTLYGNTDANQLTGNAAANNLFGLGGDDWLYGMGGSDKLDGGTGGTDHLFGGTGNDVYFIRDRLDQVTEYAGEGRDIVKAFVNYTLGDNVESLTLLGDARNGTGNQLDNILRGQNLVNVLHGGAGNDRVFGGGGNDSIFGDAGIDRLYGQAGDDILFGGSERDFLSGGVGADRFVFREGDTGASFGTADIITDFTHAQGDLIDLRSIDAKVGAGNQAFTFIGDAAFSGNAGELRFEQIGSSTRVYADVDGDGVADFMIRLNGLHDLQASDFML
ncbi:calcium-binding protein [Qipengyuania marisflavi]|uniref:Calcium-binding protein n=1 Tax=Qipengyuania marisflavi TaxID=2486356 RepID=A0A5S3P2L7_9SPHN|nr:calcium-binding protein [Qipengyuania marisflavi]TMM46198.1 hypothetical protein FEV51_11355 [Qipengyuania marisflavi]